MLVNAKLNEKLQAAGQPQSIDIMRFQQFNEEVSHYLNERQLNSCQQSPTRKNEGNLKAQCREQSKLDRSQMSAISERTFEESRILEQSQSLLSSNQQYELDENGYLLLKGHPVMDSSGC